jgi:hypothetical protein
MGLQSEDHITVLVARPCSTCVKLSLCLDTSFARLHGKSVSHHPHASSVPAFFSCIALSGMVLCAMLSFVCFMLSHKNSHLHAEIGPMCTDHSTCC